MSKQVILTDRVMEPIAHFSHAVRVGNLIHLGATAGTDAARRLAGVTPGLVDVAAQTEKMFDNARIVLEMLGAGLPDVLRVKTYIADLRDLPIYRAGYDRTFSGIRPDHVVVGSAGFPLPQAALELALVATVGAPVERFSDAGDAAQAQGRCYCTAVPTPDAADIHLSLEDAFTRQAGTAFEQLKAALSAAGRSLGETAYLHVTFSDVRLIEAFRSCFRSWFLQETAHLHGRHRATGAAGRHAFDGGGRGGGRRSADRRGRYRSGTRRSAHPPCLRGRRVVHRRAVWRRQERSPGRRDRGPDESGLGSRPVTSGSRRDDRGSHPANEQHPHRLALVCRVQCRLWGQCPASRTRPAPPCSARSVCRGRWSRSRRSRTAEVTRRSSCRPGAVRDSAYACQRLVFHRGSCLHWLTPATPHTPPRAGRWPAPLPSRGQPRRASGCRSRRATAAGARRTR